MDIAAFLTARYDEEETVARHAAHIAQAAGVHWVVGSSRYVEDYEFVSITTAPPNVIEVAGSGFDDTGGIHGLVYAEHIVRHDPARVLADLAAKRAIVAHYVDMIGDDLAEYLEPLLHMLAAPYAGHADYDKAWQVGD